MRLASGPRGRVVLIHPRSVTGWQAQPWRDLPLELLCVATPLVNAGFDVKIIDQRVSPDWRRQLLRELKLAHVSLFGP
jgi:hypothetical protein